MTLKQLGLTPEIIRRHVVAIAPPATKDEIVFSGNANYRRDKSRQLRAAYKAAGLTTAGTPPKRKKRPELAGLSRREYNTQYAKAWRASKKGIQP